VKKHVVRIALGLLAVLCILGHTARYYRIPFIPTLEAVLYDTRLRLTMPRTTDARIVIVDIDEQSLAAEGRWPWSRDRLGLLLDRLFDDYHAQVVGFDIVFAERDESSGLKVLRELANHQLRDVPGFPAALREVEPALEFDRIFADKMRNRAVVLGYYFSNQPTETATRVGALPEPVLPRGIFQGRNIQATQWTGYGANLPELQAAAASAGHFNPWPDDDGVTRRVPMLAEAVDGYYEPLSLAVLRLLVGSPPVRPGFTAAAGWSRSYPGLEWLDVGQYRVPVDEGRPRGQDRLGRCIRSGIAGPTLYSRRAGVSGGRDPRQSHLRHPRQDDQADAALCPRGGVYPAGRRGRNDGAGPAFA
jgi:adenylate cyclase